MIKLFKNTNNKKEQTKTMDILTSKVYDAALITKELIPQFSIQFYFNNKTYNLSKVVNVLSNPDTGTYGLVNGYSLILIENKVHQTPLVYLSSIGTGYDINTILSGDIVEKERILDIIFEAKEEILAAMKNQKVINTKSLKELARGY